jgi:hypothetical protein
MLKIIIIKNDISFTGATDKGTKESIQAHESREFGNSVSPKLCKIRHKINPSIINVHG